MAFQTISKTILPKPSKSISTPISSLIKGHLFLGLLFGPMSCGLDEGEMNAPTVERISLSQESKVLSRISSTAEITSALDLGPNHSLRTMREYSDQGNKTHVRTRQHFNGIPIFGEHVIVSKSENGRITKLHGNLIRGISNEIVDGEPNLSVASAYSIAKRRNSQERVSLSPLADSNPERTIYRNEKSELTIYVDDENRAHLAYSVSFFADTPEGGSPSRPHFIVDANSGEVLKEWDGLAFEMVGTGPGGNSRVGAVEYGTDQEFLDVTIVGDTAFMENSRVKTIDLNHTTIGTEAFSFPKFRNTHKSINGGFGPINDAHFAGNTCIDMYNAYHGAPPLASQLKLGVHYSDSFENAFWDGDTAFLGDGANRFHPLVSVGVVTHEVSHGFTERNSGLVLIGQSAGINESFSDMAAETAEYFLTGSTDYIIGNEVLKAEAAFRYMYDPPLKPGQIDHLDDYRDGLNAHFSSGIFNKAFYLLSTSSGWDVPMTFKVFARANQLYWTPPCARVVAASEF